VTAVILTYHAVEAGRPPLCIEPGLFRTHAQAIAESGAQSLTVSELAGCLRAGKLPERAVAITFDDGCESVVTNAAPVLAEYGLRGTIFCVAGHLGGANDWPGQRPSADRLRLATAADLAELSGSGFEIGSHGRAHIALSHAAASAAACEVEESKTALEAAVGVAVTSFAWPYGSEPGAEARRRIAATYAAACSTEMTRVGPSSDPLALPRVDAHYVRRPELMRRVLAGGLDEYLRVRRLAGRVRRAVRKDYT